MPATHVTVPAGVPRRRGRLDRSEQRRELWLAAALLTAVVIAEAALIFAAAHTVADISAIYATVP